MTESHVTKKQQWFGVAFFINFEKREEITLQITTSTDIFQFSEE